MLMTRAIADLGPVVEVTSEAEAIEALAAGARPVRTRVLGEARDDPRPTLPHKGPGSFPSTHWPYRHRATPEGVVVTVPRSMHAGLRLDLRRRLRPHFGPIRIEEAPDSTFGLFADGTVADGE